MRTGGRAGTGPGSTDGAASCIRGLWAYRAAERDRGLVATRQLHARLGPALRRSAQHEAVRERLRGDRVEVRADSRGVRAEVRDELRAEGDAAVGADLEGARPRRGHHGGDRGSELPADLRQERLDPPLDELGFVADPDDLLDALLDVIADEV